MHLYTFHSGVFVVVVVIHLNFIALFCIKSLVFFVITHIMKNLRFSTEVLQLDDEVRQLFQIFVNLIDECRAP